MTNHKVHIFKKIINWGDLDSLKIVFYPRYYEWMDNAGHMFFHSIGLNMWKLWEERKILFSLIETGCKYRRPGRYFMEIEIRTYLSELKTKALTLSHDVYDDSGKLLLEGFERRICVDTSNYSHFKSKYIPYDIYQVLKQYLVD